MPKAPGAYMREAGKAFGAGTLFGADLEFKSRKEWIDAAPNSPEVQREIDRRARRRS